MKRILLPLILLISLSTAPVVLSPNIVGAAEPTDVIKSVCDNPHATEKPKVCSDNQTATGDDNSPILGPGGIVTKGVQILVVIVGIASVIVIIVGGLKLTTSGGNPENQASGRRAIVYAIVGLMIALLSQLIVSFVLNKV